MDLLCVTRRERDVIELLALDLPYADIGQRLGIKKGSVKAHTNRLFDKFGVKNRWQLVREFFPNHGVVIYDGYKGIPLNRGYFALVDDEDYERVMQFKWSYRISRGHVYACRMDYASSGERTSVPLHRFIVGASKGVFVDHIDGDTLNCRRYNLRQCSNAENLRNRGAQKNNKSGYKGVCWANGIQKWMAQIKVNRKTIHLGNFDDVLEAAQAYRAAAIKYHGEFAKW